MKNPIKATTLILVALGLGTLLGGCALQESKPFNCATADADIQSLKNDNSTNRDTKDHDQMIRDQIAAIKKACPGVTAE